MRTLTPMPMPAQRPLLVRLKPVLRTVLAVGMMAIGLRHFTHPEPFVRIVPSFLPDPALLVYVSGVAEILGGLGLLFPLTRRWAAFGLVALYVAVFPANINMAVNHIALVPGQPIADGLLWARLPLQGVLIAWAWWYTRP